MTARGDGSNVAHAFVRPFFRPEHVKSLVLTFFLKEKKRYEDDDDNNDHMD